MKGERGGRCEGIFLRQVYDKGRERKREMREGDVEGWWVREIAKRREKGAPSFRLRRSVKGGKHDINCVKSV